MKYRRIFTIVVDSFGIGAMPDADRFEDTGADTLGHIDQAAGPLNLPNLAGLGLGGSILSGAAKLLRRGGTMEFCRRPALARTP